MARRGRKPDFTPERIEIICRAIEQGKTSADAARIGGISESTFYEWQNRHPDFSEAVKRAKAAYEEWERNELLASARRSLRDLIVGVTYDEIKTEYEQDPKDPNKPRVKKQFRTTKKVMPNATAVIFALCNRDPEHWQNRVSQDINGKVDVEQKGDGVSLANVPDELLAKVIEAINGK